MIVRTRSVALLLFGSGFCALIYQTTWLREFRLIFGSSTAATAAVIGVFMAGLGFGGIILGRRSETKTHPLAFYANLELLIAISAALSPLIIFGGRYLYIVAGGTGVFGTFFGTLLRLVLAALIMGTPTFLMGGTLPAAARVVTASEDTGRRMVGALYGANTLGAVAGIAAGTFYCFEHFGNRMTLWLAALVNVLIASVAFRLSKSAAAFAPTSKASSKSEPKKVRPTLDPRFVLVAAAVVGFVFFLMELVWYRMLGPLLGGSTFSFALILAVALLGIGLGGITYGLFDWRRSVSIQFFAMTCAAEALFIALPYALGDRIALATMLLRPLGTLGFYGHIIAWTGLCSLVVLPAAFISGLQFPFLIALVGEGKKEVGSQTGSTYAWNTLGALGGSLAGGFGFIPMLSAPGVWRLVVLLLCVLAVIATFASIRRSGHWIRITAPLVTVVIAILMLAATGPTAFWRHSQIGVGQVTQFQGSSNQMRDLMERIRRETTWETDGIESSIALSSGDGLAFIVNGRADGNAKRDAGTQVMLGLIGAALHPEPAKAMVIGLGTGSSAGWLAAVPNIAQVDVVELEPAVLKVAERCASVNQNALLNPKLHVTIGDAREILLTTREKYDLIVSEPSNPYRAGIAGLFTRNYYQSIDQRLRPDGIFLQWVQAYDIDDRTMEIIYRTLGSVFPNIETWQMQTGDLALMASHSPVRYRMDLLRSRLAQEPFKGALLAAWRSTVAEDFLGHYVGNNTLAEALQNLGPAPINTDDQTVIEFSLVRSMGSMNGFQVSNLRASAHEAGVDRPQNVEGDVDWSVVDEARFSMFSSLSRAQQNQMTLPADQRTRAAAFASYSDGDLEAGLRYWRMQTQEPKTLSQLMMVSECLAASGEATALPYIDKLQEYLPRDAEAIRAELYWRQNQPEQAVDALEKFFRALIDDPWPSHDLIQRSLTRAESLARSDRSRTAADFLYHALRKPFAVFNNDSDRLAAGLAIGVHLDGGRPGVNTIAALMPYEPHVVWGRQFLQLRKDCYTALNNPLAEKARRDLDEFMSHEAETSDVSTLTKQIQARSGTAGTH